MNKKFTKGEIIYIDDDDDEAEVDQEEQQLIDIETRQRASNIGDDEYAGIVKENLSEQRKPKPVREKIICSFPLPQNRYYLIRFYQVISFGYFFIL